MKLVYTFDPNPALLQAFTDLDIAKLLTAAEPELTQEAALQWANTYFTNNAAELRERYAIFEDWTDLAAVTNAYTLIVSLREELGKLSRSVDALHEVLYKSRVLTCLYDAIAALTALTAQTAHSKRLSELHTFLAQIIDSREYAAGTTALTDVRALITFPQTVYVGINAREDAEPVDIAVLRDAKDVVPSQALIDGQAPTAVADSLFPDMQYSRTQYGTHFEEFLLHHIEKHYHSDIQKAAKRIHDVVLFATEPLLELEESLRFYKIGLQLQRLFLERGYTLCCPDPYGMDIAGERIVYPDLALHLPGLAGESILVTDGSSTLITGANHSGKTSYLKTIGQSLVLAQLGFFVVAQSFSYRPFHYLYTLFSAGEDSSMSVSRMGVEIQKLTGILNEAQSSDLVLINEPMTSTNPVEAVSICAELMDHFLQKHITHMVVTHLYDIYYLLVSRLSEADRARLHSLVTESYYDPTAGMVHTYKLTVSAPRGNSYAMETAKQFGITLEDLLKDATFVQAASDYLNTEDATSIYQGGDAHGLSHEGNR